MPLQRCNRLGLFGDSVLGASQLQRRRCRIVGAFASEMTVSRHRVRVVALKARPLRRRCRDCRPLLPLRILRAPLQRLQTPRRRCRFRGAAPRTPLPRRRFREFALERSLRRHRFTDASSQTLYSTRSLGNAAAVETPLRRSNMSPQRCRSRDAGSKCMHGHSFEALLGPPTRAAGFPPNRGAGAASRRRQRPLRQDTFRCLGSWALMIPGSR